MNDSPHFIAHPHDTTSTNFTVIIRIRPPLARELNGESGFVDVSFFLVLNLPLVDFER